MLKKDKIKTKPGSHWPSETTVRFWLFSLSEGLKRVRSLKLQLFWTLAGLPPISSPPPTASFPGEHRWRSLMEVCRLFMLWPRGLAIRTRSLKLNFWLGGWEDDEEEMWWRKEIRGEEERNICQKSFSDQTLRSVLSLRPDTIYPADMPRKLQKKKIKARLLAKAANQNVQLWHLCLICWSLRLKGNLYILFI